MLAGACAVFFRLVWLQVVVSDDLAQIADDQHHAKMVIEPRRGTIFDRNGRPLTTDLGDFVTLGVNPSRVLKRKELASDLARETGRQPSYYLSRLNRKAQFIILDRKVSLQSADKLDRKGWNLVRQPDTKRYYPHHQVAGQIVGFTDIDQNGLSGIELSCDPILRGEPGWRVVQLDVQGRPHLDGSLPAKAAIDGVDVALTIDLAIQTITEEELAAALTESKSETASAVVLDVETGEILAMATVPCYDPNEPAESPPERQKVRSVVDLFEPGSTFKLIGSALLLERGWAKPATRVDVSAGKITVANHVISDAHNLCDAHNRGLIDFRQVVSLSSNVGMIKLTQNIAPQELYDMVARFGFLVKTDVELEGEASGILPKPKKWNGLTKANLVIGQGIAVTGLQMALAYGAVANDGVLMQPTLLKGRYAVDGTLVEEPPLPVRRVISSETAHTLTSFFIDVVDKGTAMRAKIEGVKAAGKTGTAQKIKPEGGYYKDRFVSSFIGYIPADSPKFLIEVVLDDPKGDSHQGGQVAAPVFRNIADRIIGLNPELRSIGKRPDKAKALRDYVVVPEVRDASLERALTVLTKLGLAAGKHGSGDFVVDQSPAGGVQAKKGEIIELTLGPGRRSGGNQVVVPFLTGLSLREALRKGSAAGLNVQFKGSGRVVRQAPASGARAAVGDVLILTLEG